MRYFIEFSYNGKNYHGYQIQPNGITIQEVLENRLSTILREPIKITAAGRTDAGVHAKKMFAHFDYNHNINSDFLVKKLNSFLPNDIAIHQFISVKSDAHARFDATERTYQYHINLNKNPFQYNFGWNIFHKPLKISEMNSAAQYLLGKQDFSSFAKLNSDVKTHICTITNATWVETDKNLVFTISADRFLRNMVRAIVGTLVSVGDGEITTAEFKEIIKKKNRSEAGVSAPAEGLYLINVEYPKEIFNE